MKMLPLDCLESYCTWTYGSCRIAENVQCALKDIGKQRTKCPHLNCCAALSDCYLHLAGWHPKHPIERRGFLFTSICLSPMPEESTCLTAQQATPHGMRGLAGKEPAPRNEREDIETKPDCNMGNQAKSLRHVAQRIETLQRQSLEETHIWQPWFCLEAPDQLDGLGGIAWLPADRVSKDTRVLKQFRSKRSSHPSGV